MQIINEPEQRVPIKAWIDGVELEASARQQLINVAKLPFAFKHIAVMPDVHWGVGATVGSVIATRGAIIPAATGVDIGCGVDAKKTNLKAEDLPDDLADLRLAIESAVPHGRTDNGGKNDRGAWGDIPQKISDLVSEEMRSGLSRVRENAGERFEQRWSDEAVFRHLGTQGSGNHYAEICLDENGEVWVMLHSGSRGIGNAIGTTYIERAKNLAKQYFIPLPDPDLAYLPEGTPSFDEYVNAVSWAQDFALLNRRAMMDAIMGVLEKSVGKVVFNDGDKAISCHHNYVSRENHFGQNVLVTRKGAVRAREGDLGIIPGSMGTRSYIVCGKGNRESFMSCSHGAGRRMSRGEAKRRITLEDHAKATEGVECRKDESVLDESPAAYKDVDAVIAAQSDLIEVVHTLKAVLCVKG